MVGPPPKGLSQPFQRRYAVVRLGHDRTSTTIETLHELAPAELLRVIELIALWRVERERQARHRGLGGLVPGRSTT